MKEEMPESSVVPEWQLPEEIQGSYIKILGRAAFIVFYSNGVRKMIQTDRLGLAMFRDLMNQAIDNPNNNKNGVTFYRDERQRG